MSRFQPGSTTNRGELSLSPTFIMPRLRKLRRPADVSVSTPTSPAELVVQTLTSQRNSRTLAASSFAIALSISSPSYDTHNTPGDGTAARGRGSGWQTTCGAVRMTVEAAKESSDVFLPLKALMGAISVLIKNYDVSVSCQRPEHLLIPSLLPF